jgi:hypothetical protein
VSDAGQPPYGTPGHIRPLLRSLLYELNEKREATGTWAGCLKTLPGANGLRKTTSRPMRPLFTNQNELGTVYLLPIPCRLGLGLAYAVCGVLCRTRGLSWQAGGRKREPTTCTAMDTHSRPQRLSAMPLRCTQRPISADHFDASTLFEWN